MANDVDEAWSQFKKDSEAFAKASVNEKLDTLAAQLNEVQTDTKRLAEIVPKIMGDETAIEGANESADPAAMMGGGMPPMDESTEMPPEEGAGDEMTGEEMPPEDALGAEEGAEEMPPEAPADETAGPAEDVTEEMPLEEDEDIDLGLDEEGYDGDEEMGGDNEAIETLKDALQEALDNDQMGLVSKIANAIAQLQGSTAEGANILAGDEDLGGESISAADVLGEASDELPEAASDETEGAEEEAPAETESEPEKESEDTEEVEKSASAGAGGPAPSGEMNATYGPDTTVATHVEASATDDVKAEVMEAVAEALDDALGAEEPEEKAEEPVVAVVEGEVHEPESDDEEEEDKNEELAENPFEQCSDGTMKKSLQFASSVSFRDLMNVKKSKRFGVDGRPALEPVAKMVEGSESMLDTQTADVAMNAEAQAPEMEVIQADVSDVESAKEAFDAPDALDPGVRTEVADDTVVEETAPPSAEQMDEVGEPLNASNPDSGLEAAEEDEAALDEIEKSSTLDEVGCAKNILKEGHKPNGGDLLDDVGVDKKPTESAEPKETLLDQIDEKKGKGSDVKTESQLDQLDPEKGEGTAKKGGDLLDDVGHEKRSTEHTVKPGTGLLDDVGEMKKSASDNGKHIMSMKEMMSIRKSSQRPDAVTSTSGDLVRPELGNPIRKTANATPVRMGRGVDPHKVTENDWAEYNLYMAQKKL